jgi:hypothetical protein
MDNRLDVDFLRGDEWESLVEVKPHLITKNTNCACTCTVMLSRSIFQDVMKQCMVLLHIGVFVYSCLEGER